MATKNRNQEIHQNQQNNNGGEVYAQHFTSSPSQQAAQQEQSQENDIMGELNMLIVDHLQKMGRQQASDILQVSSI